MGRGARGGEGALRRAEGHAAGAGAPAGQREAGVLALLPHRRDVLDARPRHQQHRRRVALAEGPDPLQLLGEVEGERSAGYHRVHRLDAQQVGRCEPLARMCREGGAEGGDRGLVDLQAGGHPVAAEAGEALARRGEAREQVVRRDAPARSPPVPPSRPITTQGRRWRSTSREATMPTTPGCHPSPATTIAAALIWSAHAASAACRMRCSVSRRSRLRRSSSPCDLFRPLGVVGEQQLERGVGAVQAPRRVDTRAEPEAGGTGVNVPGLERRHAHQRPDARSGGPGERGQALPRDAPVLAVERHHVAHGREPREVEILLRAREGLGELEHHTGGAQLARRLLPKPRVHRRAGRQLVPRPVMVGHEHVHAESTRLGDLGHGRDAAVHGDQQPGAGPASERTTSGESP